MKIEMQPWLPFALLVGGLHAALLGSTTVGQDKGDVVAAAPPPMFVEARDAIRLEDCSRQKWGSPVIADFDHDGRLDLLVNDHGHQTVLYWNEGRSFSKPVVLTRRDKHGVGVGDFDDDGRLDLVISQGGGGGKKPKNPVWFRVNRDRTIDGGEEIAEFVRSRGRAVKFIDADNDGRPEVLHTAFPLKSQTEEGGNILYALQSTGGFAISSHLPRTPWMGFRALVTDYNGDHDADVLFFGGKNITVAKGGTDATFSDASEEALGLLARTTFVSSIAEIDYDNDGDFDLFVTRCDHPFNPEASFDPDQRRYYFFTRQNKGFDLDRITIDGDLRVENFQTAYPPSDVFLGTEKRKLDLPGGKFGQKDFTLKPADAQGWPEDTSAQGIYIGHLGDNVWHVRAETKAANSAVLLGVKSDLEGLARESMPARLFENRDGMFVDVTRRMGIVISEQTVSSAVGDFDNDGWSDLFIVRYGDPTQPNEQLLYLNNQGEGFTRVEHHGLVSQELGSTGAGGEAFDYDADGDLDITFGNERGRWHLFTNTSTASDANHYLVVDVGRSPTGSASPQYATLTLKAGGLTFKRAVNGNSHGLNQSLNTQLHVGLGSIEDIDEATVRWSNGETQELRIESVDRLVSAGKTD